MSTLTQHLQIDIGAGTLANTNRLRRKSSTCALSSSSASGDDYETAYNSALFHLAQLTWQHGDGIRPPDFLNVVLQKECREYFRWQVGYRFLQAQGMDDPAIRERLLHHGRDLELPICYRCERNAPIKNNGAWECESCAVSCPIFAHSSNSVSSTLFLITASYKSVQKHEER